MKLKLLVLALSLPCFIQASIKLEVDIKMDDEQITKEVTVEEGEHVCYDCDKYLLEATVTPEEEQAVINLHICKKTDEGNTLVCQPTIKASWGEKAELNCSFCKNESGSARCSMSVIATQV